MLQCMIPYTRGAAKHAIVDYWKVEVITFVVEFCQSFCLIRDEDQDKTKGVYCVFKSSSLWVHELNDDNYLITYEHCSGKEHRLFNGS